jgi:hypothetical protein
MAAQVARPRWADLAPAARLFRIAHGTWGALNLIGLALVWRAGLTRSRDKRVYASAALLLAEGAALVVGRGDCPFGPFQAGLGDPVPMFEWFLPPRAAKAAIPALTLVTVCGLMVLWLRPPEPRQSATWSWRAARVTNTSRASATLAPMRSLIA